MAKDDVHKIHHQVSNAEQHISTVEDLTPLMVTVRDEVADHKSQAANYAI